MVNITKSPPPLNSLNRRNTKKSLENTGLSQQNEIRLLRYQMQSVAKHILPGNRVGICLRYQMEKYGIVDVYKHRQTQRAFYGGLMICGSVWVCPVCAAKISERRRSELRQAFDAHIASGGHCTMLTLTFSHSRTDKLSDLLEKLSAATLKFRTGKRSDKLRAEIGEIGSIRCFEVTYGVNGWHPHIHLLLMHKIEIDPWERSYLEEKYYDLWEAACAKSDLETSAAHGLRLDDAHEADTYIGKWGDIMPRTWGVDREMTKANSKKGKEGSMTPFDFLRVVVEEGDLMYT
ncbi:protein rep, partial [Paenibacillus sinopodophylli]|uniref:protein rep n=1 Tax=Paenibacillus sinopodophylli TaxID=1837342 RepID=UPI00110CDBA1